MKFTKMSLVAALLVGSSAFAIENTKVSGDAKLYYSTSNTAKNDLFNKAGSAGQAAVSLSLSSDLTKGVSAGTKITALSTLGLQGQLVNNVWEGTNGVSDSYIVNDLWLAATVAKTTAKIGRMELDTPLVFSEKWSIVENTFEAAVVINQDIPNTTLVGAYVGGSNGQLLGATAGTADTFYTSTDTLPAGVSVGDPKGVVGIANVVQGTSNETTFNQFYKGAYAAGVVNNSWAPLTAQAWYYDASSTVTAYWLQADLNMNGIIAGAQFAGLDADAAADDNTVYAVMAGYAMKDVATVKIAYSSVSDDAGIGAGQNLAGSGQSKLYTEAWWNYGYVTRVDTSALNLTAEGTVSDIDLGFYYTQTETGSGASEIDMTEITLSASYTFGPLDTSLVYFRTDADDKNVDAVGTAHEYDTIQAYLTYNF